MTVAQMDSRYYEDAFPLSPVQRQLLLESQHAAAPARMLYQFTCIIEGNLDVQAFRRAWQKTADFNPGLRMAFLSGDRREPEQVVNREILVDFEIQDWRALAKTLRQNNYAKFLEKDRNNTFELTRAPIWRLTVIRLEDARFRLIWTYHVLLLDQKSVRLILDEVFGRYEAVLARREIFPLEAASTRAYVEWVRSQDPARAEEFWRRELRNCRVQGTNISDHLRVSLEENLLAACDRMQTVTGISVETLVQAAWALNLSEEVGRNEFLLGVQVPARPKEIPSAGGIIAHLANTLPLRVTIDASMKGIDCLSALQRQKDAMGLYEHCSLRQIQRWAGISSEIKTFPGDNIMVRLPADIPIAKAAGGALQMRESVLIRKDRVPTTIEIDRLMAGHSRPENRSPREQRLERIITGLIRQPQATIARILNSTRGSGAKIVTGAPASRAMAASTEREQGWVTWIRTESGINDLFLEKVAKSPGAIAVESDGSTLTYGELNTQACQVARHLVRLGVGPQVPVGLYLAPGRYLALALLGVVKTGAAYVPLDPQQEFDGARQILEALVPPVVLTTTELRAKLPSGKTPYRILCLDGDWEKFAAEKPEMFGIQVSDAHPACIVGQGSSQIMTRISHVELAHALSRTDDWFEFSGGNAWKVAAAGPSKKLLESAQLFGLTQSRPEPPPLVQNKRLSPVQQWFFEQHPLEPRHDNKSILVEVTDKLEERFLREAIHFLQCSHDNLRLRFKRTAGMWNPEVAPVLDDIPFEYVDLSEKWAGGQREAIEEKSSVLQRSLDLEAGPLWRVVYFDLGARADRMLLIFHTLVGGEQSLRIFLDGLLVAYRQIKNGQTPILPVRTIAYREWVDRLHQRADEGRLNEEVGYWSRMKQGASLPIERPDAPNTYGTMESVLVSLTENETADLLSRVTPDREGEANEIILTALALALARWSGENQALIEVEVNGRSNPWVNLDVSETIGWFGVRYPVLLHVGQTPAEALRLVHTQLLAVPNQGIGYGMLRYFSDAATRRRLRELASAQVRFTFLEKVARSAGWKTVPENLGIERHGENKRDVAIAVSARLNEGVMEFEWRYSRDQFEQQNIGTLVNSFIEELQRL